MHPHGRNIDRVKNHQRSETELIDMIDMLFFKAEEQLQEFDTNEKEGSDSDDEQVLDLLRENVSQELQLQKNEFQSAIENLITEFNSILSSARDADRYDQCQRIYRQLEREFKRWQSRLPIYARRSDIIEKLRQNQVLILKADTGSGKSTQTVQYLCDEHFADYSKQTTFFLLFHFMSFSFFLEQIISTQPRKLAARSLAARVAEEYGCQVGEEVSRRTFII
jgi:HrpA-like RNA helicase